MAEQIVFPVSLKLEVLQSSVAELRKVLDNLSPDTKGYKDLAKIIDGISNEMRNLQTMSARGFVNQGQFDRAGKSIDKIEESLIKAQLALGDIKFSDLKLDAGQQEQLKQIEDGIAAVGERYNQVKEQTKQELINTDSFKRGLEQIGAGDFINKSFDEIQAKLESGLSKLQEKLAKARAEVNNTQAAQIRSLLAESLTGTGFSNDTAALLKQTDLSKFFTGFDTGNLKFNTSIKGGGGVKEQFIQALQKYFSLDDADIEQLRNKTFSDLSKLFQAMGDEKNPTRNIFEKVKASSSFAKSLTDAFNNEDAIKFQIQQVQEAKAQMDAVLSDNGQVGAAGAEAQAAIAKYNDELAKLQQIFVANVKGSQDFAHGITSGNTALDSFRNELSTVNAEMLKMQNMQRTFSGIKSAIINFMGFTQVLNLTKRAISEAAQHIQKLDSIMNQIAVVTDMTTADLWDQVDTYSQIAQKIGVSIEGAYEVSKIFYLQGLQTADVMELTEETLKLAKIAGTDYATTTDYMTTALRGFNMEMSEASTVVDVYSALASNTAISQAELAEAMTRTASSAEAVGMSLEQTSAVISTMVAVTRETSSNIGSALKSIASR